MSNFIDRISNLSKKCSRKGVIVYFNNFSRFDGILLIKHLVNNSEFTLKPLMRNGVLYQLRVYEGKKAVFTFRDSLLLNPGSLDSLASSLCPGWKR